MPALASATVRGVRAEEFTAKRAEFDASVLRARLERVSRAKLRVHGGSMRPVLPPGRRARLRRVRSGESLQGAIVAFETAAGVVVHQVIAESGLDSDSRVVTQGTTARQPDGARRRGELIGIVDRVEGLALPERALRIGCIATRETLRAARELKRRLRGL